MLDRVLCRESYLGDYRSSPSSVLLEVLLTILTVKVPVRVACRKKQQKIKVDHQSSGVSVG